MTFRNDHLIMHKMGKGVTLSKEELIKLKDFWVDETCKLGVCESKVSSL